MCSLKSYIRRVILNQLIFCKIIYNHKSLIYLIYFTRVHNIKKRRFYDKINQTPFLITPLFMSPGIIYYLNNRGFVIVSLTRHYHYYLLHITFCVPFVRPEPSTGKPPRPLKTLASASAMPHFVSRYEFGPPNLYCRGDVRQT